jgi:hypothetical protein
MREARKRYTALAVAIIVTLAVAGSAVASKPDKPEKAESAKKAKPAQAAPAHVKAPKPKKDHKHEVTTRPTAVPDAGPGEASTSTSHRSEVPKSHRSGAPKSHRSEAPKSHGSAAPHHKVALCHATGSKTNPYVLITVSVNATAGNGHGRHEDDIIPAPAAGCPSGETEDPGNSSGGGSGGGDDPKPTGGGGRETPILDGQPSAPPSAFTPAAQEELPFTGFPVWALALVGAGAAGAGVLLRRKGRPSGSATMPPRR